RSRAAHPGPRTLGHRGSVRPPRPQFHVASSDRLSLLPKGARRDPDHLGTESQQNRTSRLRKKVVAMRKSYDFSKGKRNPYAKRLKRQVTIRLDETTIAYFNELAEEIGIPYQSLINLYLRECASSHKRLDLRWRPPSHRAAQSTE